MVAAILFFLATFLSPLFGQIPQIATSPILVLVGVLIFASAVGDINWEDMSGEGAGRERNASFNWSFGGAPLAPPWRHHAPSAGG